MDGELPQNLFTREEAAGTGAPVRYAETFTIPSVTPLLNETMRTHFRDMKRLQLGLAWEVKAASVGRVPFIPLRRARVTIERRSVGTPDTDNLVGGVKVLVDVLLVPKFLPARVEGKPGRFRHQCGLSFIEDDGPSVLDLHVRALRVTKKQQCTVIIIEEVATD